MLQIPFAIGKVIAPIIKMTNTKGKLRSSGFAGILAW